MSATTSTPASVLGPSTTPTSAPLPHLLPYLQHTYTLIHRIASFSLSLLRPIAVLSPVPVLLYIFAPVIVFMDILTTIFIRAPYAVVVYLLDALFPLYVFCGVACITGGIIGLTARLLCRAVVACVENKGDVEGDEHEMNVTLKKEKEKEEADVKGKGKGKGKVDVKGKGKARMADDDGEDG
ncbi:hypothetical protein D9613_004037 [Agrocybe pediades]|uniref:Uncharacterized protein n=1 Tax=Agrocybe pediades TaxID=84607 RepID=A0A8H4QK54_9AGAR|nr:hypothetical protein D9613_004037 [Agrocybe pediades]